MADKPGFIKHNLETETNLYTDRFVRPKGTFVFQSLNVDCKLCLRGIDMADYE